MSARRDSFTTVPETCPRVDPKYEFALNRLKELEKFADDLGKLAATEGACRSQSSRSG
jgi:hypothetical protein